MERIKKKAVSTYRKFKTTNPFSICKELGYTVIIESLGNMKGYTTTNYRITSIHINEDLTEEEKLFTCSHELGHILLCHSHNKIFLSKNTYINTERFEKEATTFAIYLALADYNKEDLEHLTRYEIGQLIGIDDKYVELI